MANFPTGTNRVFPNTENREPTSVINEIMEIVQNWTPPQAATLRTAMIECVEQGIIAIKDAIAKLGPSVAKEWGLTGENSETVSQQIADKAADSVFSGPLAVAIAKLEREFDRPLQVNDVDLIVKFATAVVDEKVGLPKEFQANLGKSLDVLLKKKVTSHTEGLVTVQSPQPGSAGTNLADKPSVEQHAQQDEAHYPKMKS